MKLNLERAVRFSQDSEHKSLYSWSLQEVAPSGEKVGRDLVPWNWTLRLTATSVQLHSDYSVRESFKNGHEVESERRESTSLFAKLVLDADYSAEFRGRGTKLSMLGTDREVTDISLRIVPTASEQEVEHCTVWGCPSFTTEVSFRYETVPDMLQLELQVEPARFREMIEALHAPHPLALVVSISSVQGFYSDWSPSIRTGSIKILVKNDDHIVEMAPNGEWSLPRLGKVGEFRLDLDRYAAIRVAPMVVADLEDAQAPTLPTSGVNVGMTPEYDAIQQVYGELAAARRAVASLSIPIWIAVVLLGLFLLTR